MIAVAVNAQGPALAIWRNNAVSRILGKIDHLHGQVFREVELPRSGLGHLKKDLQLFIVAQLKTPPNPCP